MLITNPKQSIFETFDIYGLNSFAAGTGRKNDGWGREGEVTKSQISTDEGVKMVVLILMR